MANGDAVDSRQLRLDHAAKQLVGGGGWQGAQAAQSVVSPLRGEQDAYGVAPSLPRRLRFAGAMRTLRELRKLSQNELARRTGLTSGYVSKLENGRSTTPSPQTVEKIALALEVPPGYLNGQAGLVDEPLLGYIESNSLIVEILNEARLGNLSTRSWERLRAALHDELRASITALSVDDDPVDDSDTPARGSWSDVANDSRIILDVLERQAFQPGSDVIYGRRQEKG